MIIIVLVLFINVIVKLLWKVLNNQTKHFFRDRYTDIVRADPNLNAK
jgi:hypothetical protein